MKFPAIVIGAIAPQVKLAVNRDIFSQKVKVTQAGCPIMYLTPAIASVNRRGAIHLTTSSLTRSSFC